MRRKTVGLRNTAGIKEGASRATRETPPHLWLLPSFEDRGSRRCGDSTEHWTFARKKEREREKKSHSDKVCVVAAGFSVSIRTPTQTPTGWLIHSQIRSPREIHYLLLGMDGGRLDIREGGRAEGRGSRARRDGGINKGVAGRWIMMR